MTNTDTPTPDGAPCSPRRRSADIRRLRRALVIALAQGAAKATGAGLVGLLLWWITHH